MLNQFEENVQELWSRVTRDTWGGGGTIYLTVEDNTISQRMIRQSELQHASTSCLIPPSRTLNKIKIKLLTNFINFSRQNKI